MKKKNKTNLKISPLQEGLEKNLYFLFTVLFFLLALLSGPITRHLDAFKLAIYVSVTIVIFLAFIVYSFLSGRSLIINLPLTGSYLLFGFCSFISLFWASYTYEADLNFLKFLINGMMIFLAINIFDTKEKVLRFIGGFVVLMGILGFLGGLEYFWGISPFKSIPGTPGQRIELSFGNTNYYGGFLVLAIPFAVSAFLYFKKEREKDLSEKERRYVNWAFWISPVIAVLGTFNLFFTMSRGAFAGLVCGFLIYIVFMVKVLKKKLRSLVFIFAGILLIVVLLFGVFYFTNNTFKSRINNAFKESPFDLKKFLSNRYYAWEGAVNMWLAKAPLSVIAGNGPGAYYAGIFTHYRPDYRIFTSERSFKHTHNEYLELLADGGVVTLASWFIFLFFPFYFSFKVLRKEKAAFDHKLIALSVITALAGGLIHCVVSLAFRMTVVFSLFSFLIALAYINYRLVYKTHKDMHSTGPVMPKFLLFGALAVILIFPVERGGRWFLSEYYALLATGAQAAKVPAEVQIELMDRGISAYKNINLMYEKSYVLKDMDPAEAVKNANEINTIIPDYRDNNLIMGISFNKQEKYDDALKVLERYIYKQDVFNEGAYFNAVCAAVMVSRKEKALKLIKDYFLYFNRYSKVHGPHSWNFPYCDFVFSDTDLKNRLIKKDDASRAVVSVSFLNQFISGLVENVSFGFDKVKANFYLGIGKIYDDIEYSDYALKYYRSALPGFRFDPQIKSFIFDRFRYYYNRVKEDIQLDDEKKNTMLLGYLKKMYSIKPSDQLKDEIEELLKE